MNQITSGRVYGYIIVIYGYIWFLKKIQKKITEFEVNLESESDLLYRKHIKRMSHSEKRKRVHS